MQNKNVLITGGAGFIGSHLVDRLLGNNCNITVLDNLDPYYDPNLKLKNLHKNIKKINFVNGDIRSTEFLETIFRQQKLDIIIHLAALAGVRPSLKRPVEYMSVNVLGTQKLIDNTIKYAKNAKFIFASSSSVYGQSNQEKFSEDMNVNSPISPYGATKIAGELLLSCAHNNHNLNSIALRFFTVYGPRQRPDLAINKFAQSIIKDQPILMYGDGKTIRDYTYIDDIVNGIIKSIEYNNDKFEIFNLGSGSPILLTDMIHHIENTLNKKAVIIKYDKQVGDMDRTYADITKAQNLLNWSPSTNFETGVAKFIDWLKPSLQLTN